MDRVNYFDEYFLGNIDCDTLIEKVQESIEDEVAYTMGAIDCAKYMYDYCDGKPIYPSEMALILDKFLANIGLSKELRKDITLTSYDVLKEGTRVKAYGRKGVIDRLAEYHGKLAYIVYIDGQVDCEVLYPEVLEVIDE